MYVIAQMSGGLLGGGILRGSVGASNYESGIVLSRQIDAGQGFVIEFMGTLLLLFVVYGTAVWTAKPHENDLGATFVSALAPLSIVMSVR